MRIAHVLLDDATAAELKDHAEQANLQCGHNEVLVVASRGQRAQLGALLQPRVRRVWLGMLPRVATRVATELAMFGPDQLLAGSAHAGALRDSLYPQRGPETAGAPRRAVRFPRRMHRGPGYFARAARYLWQRRVRRPQTIVAAARYCGMSFEARTADRHARKLSRHGMHEPAISAWIVEHLRLRGGDVMLDVGANIGWYAVLCDRMAEPGAAIFAFEPDPDNVALLRANLERNHASRVQVVTSAVSDSERVATLHRYAGGNRGQHTLLPLYSGDDIQVRTTTLDGFWMRAALDARRLRLLKIDIEGHEAAALRGAAGVLRRCELLLMEYSPRFLRAAQLDVDEPLQLPAAAGLRAYLFAGEELRPTTPEALRGVAGQANLLWMR
jgi:FkbM family methyltransferase